MFRLPFFFYFLWTLSSLAIMHNVQRLHIKNSRILSNNKHIMKCLNIRPYEWYVQIFIMTWRVLKLLCVPACDLKTRLICSHVCVFDKQFRVVLHKDARGQLSNAIQLGVPQASVLEPLLYLLYTRNIPLQVTQRQRLRMVPIILTNTIRCTTSYRPIR